MTIKKYLEKLQQLKLYLDSVGISIEAKSCENTLISKETKKQNLK